MPTSTEASPIPAPPLRPIEIGADEFSELPELEEIVASEKAAKENGDIVNDLLLERSQSVGLRPSGQEVIFNKERLGGKFGFNKFTYFHSLESPGSYLFLAKMQRSDGPGLLTVRIEEGEMTGVSATDQKLIDRLDPASRERLRSLLLYGYAIVTTPRFSKDTGAGHKPPEKLTGYEETVQPPRYPTSETEQPKGVPRSVNTRFIIPTRTGPGGKPEDFRFGYELLYKLYLEEKSKQQASGEASPLTDDEEWILEKKTTVLANSDEIQRYVQVLERSSGERRKKLEKQLAIVEHLGELMSRDQILDAYLREQNPHATPGEVFRLEREAIRKIRALFHDKVMAILRAIPQDDTSELDRLGLQHYHHVEVSR